MNDSQRPPSDRPDPDLPNIDQRLFHNALRTGPATIILLLYGSLRQRVQSADERRSGPTAHGHGADARIYSPHGLPLADAEVTPESSGAAPGRVVGRHGLVFARATRLDDLMKPRSTGYRCRWARFARPRARPGRDAGRGGSQSFNTVNQLRVLGRWMRMVTILGAQGLSGIRRRRPHEAFGVLRPDRASWRNWSSSRCWCATVAATPTGTPNARKVPIEQARQPAGDLTTPIRRAQYKPHADAAPSHVSRDRKQLLADSVAGSRDLEFGSITVAAPGVAESSKSQGRSRRSDSPVLDIQPLPPTALAPARRPCLH